MDKNLIYLVQTDTTVGFSSANDEKLSVAKKRDQKQKILQTIDSFANLKNNVSIPKKYRKLVRHSKKTTFIYPNNKAFRVIDKDDDFYDFIKKFGSLYSSSANQTNKDFSYEYAFDKAEVIVENKKHFSQEKASSIIKLSKKNKKYIRKIKN